MRRACLIINPNSGRNRRKPRLRELLGKWALEAGIEATLELTGHPGHAAEIARNAANRFDCVVAVGGDGTMNEVACGAMAAGIPIGILPCGSGNSLARHLKIPLDLRAAMRVIATGRPRSIDSGIANGHRFFNAMGVGLDAEICRRFNKMSYRVGARYISTGARVFLNYRPARYSIVAGADRRVLDAFLISIVNSDQYGNGAYIAPGARVDDGVLDLVALQPSGFLSAAAMALRLFTGSLDRVAGVTRLAGTRFEISRDGDGVIHVDGETRATGPKIEVEVVPRSLKIIVPAY